MGDNGLSERKHVTTPELVGGWHRRGETPPLSRGTAADTDLTRDRGGAC